MGFVRQFIIIFLIVFAAVWGLGLFFGYMSGIKYLKPSQAPKTISATEQLEEQKQMTDESRQLQQKMMQSYQFQTQDMQRSLETLPNLR